MQGKRRRGVIDADTQPKQRVNVRLAPETYKRLLIHSVMSAKEPGKILDELINLHLREWKVQANVTARVISSDRLDITHEISSPALSVA
jgi:hypothetical protein